jgi:hypothetical protein
MPFKERRGRGSALVRTRKVHCSALVGSSVLMDDLPSLFFAPSFFGLVVIIKLDQLWEREAQRVGWRMMSGNWILLRWRRDKTGKGLE